MMIVCEAVVFGIDWRRHTGNTRLESPGLYIHLILHDELGDQ